MKLFVALFFCLAASSAATLYERRLLGSHLEDLITKALEYSRSLLKKHEPFYLPNLRDQPLTDTDIDLLFSISGVEVTKSSDFKIDSIKVDTAALKSSFQLAIPLNHGEGILGISGTVKGKKADGEGPYSSNVTDLVISGTVQVDIIDHLIQIQDITLDFSIGDFKIDAEGLSIEGLDKKQINDLLNKQFINFINENKFFVEKIVSLYMLDLANVAVYGRSVDEVIAWLEKFVASTPDIPFYAATLSP